LKRNNKRQGCRFIFHNYIQFLKNILHGLVGQWKVKCVSSFMFEVVWTQSPLISKLYFLTNEIVCILLIKMNVILVIVDIQNIHENKNMTWNLRKLLTIVDDLSDPKWLIIWSIHMNTHIILLYVVNFKLNPKWHNKYLHLYMDISWWGN
jgi:hypothetical protein